MDWRSRMFLGGGIVLALLAGLATWIVLSRARALGPNSAVVVAAVDIPERTLITAGNVSRLLTIQQLPTNQVPPGALIDPQAALGKALSAPIAAHDVLVDSKL